jgi:xanthine dehydrogenase accessory factor
MNFKQMRIVVKGGGEVASAVAHRLTRAGFWVCLTEITRPLAVHRGTTFSEAVYKDEMTVEGLTAKLIQSPGQAAEVWREGKIPLLVDPEARCIANLRPRVVVDARMLKKNTDTGMQDAALVIGIGPGFYAGRDVHLVIESYHDENLGRVIEYGEALVNNAIPISIGGYNFERAVHAEEEGDFTCVKTLGEQVVKGELIAYLNGREIRAEIGGIIRAILPSNLHVDRGTKLIEIDPEASAEACYIIRAKMRAIAGGVLEGILGSFNK